MATNLDQEKGIVKGRMTNICQTCQTNLPGDAKFCPQCGTPLAGGTASVVAS